MKFSRNDGGVAHALRFSGVYLNEPKGSAWVCVKTVCTYINTGARAMFTRNLAQPLHPNVEYTGVSLVSDASVTIITSQCVSASYS